MTAVALDAAFRATTYRVFCGEAGAGGSSAFALRVGEPNTAFDAFLRALSHDDHTGWSIVTACNPAAKLDPGGNAQRQTRLRQRLERGLWSYWPACNIADDGTWPDEPGFLIFPIGESEARALAGDFGQTACVFGEIGGVPQLAWTGQPSI